MSSRSPKVALVSAFATRQGKHPGRTAWDLGVEAYRGALHESGIDRSKIDGLITQMSQDRSGQMEPSRFGQMIGLNPRVNGSLHYGTAAFALPYAAGLIESGQCNVVACVYATNQRTTHYRFAESYEPFGTPYGAFNPACYVGLGFQRYLYEYDRLGDRDKLGAVAIAFRKHAILNPIAHIRQPLTWDAYLDDRWIIWPLRRADICLITDGAVCLILADATLAKEMTAKPVYLAGIGRQDALGGFEQNDPLLLAHQRKTAEMVRSSAGVTTGDIDALYVQDAHAPAVIFALENYGFCPEGEALDFIQGGRIELGGELPINSNGGQLAEGYMVGWLHHVELFKQLRGEGGARQIPQCNIAQFCGTGSFRFTSSLIYVNDEAVS